MGAATSVQALLPGTKQARGARFASTELIAVGSCADVVEHKAGGAGRDNKQDEQQLHHFESSAASIKAPLLRKLASVKSFSPDEYARGVIRPLPLLAFMTIRAAATSVNASAFPMLPTILSHVEICVTKAGGALYARKLYQLQALYAQTQPGGALVRVVNLHPILVLAAVLAALLEDVPGLGGRGGGQLVRAGSMNKLRARMSRVDDDSGVSALPPSWPATKRFLMTSAYYKALNNTEQADLLTAVDEFSAVSADRVATAHILNSWRHCSDFDGRGLEEPRQLLHGILFLARISYLSRNFKAHRAWCAHRVSQLQDVHLGARKQYGFAFFPAQLSDQRFYEAHTHVVNRVLLPYMCSIARSISSTVVHEVCVTATMVAKTLGENSERAALQTRRASDGPLTPVADIESILAADTVTSLADKLLRLDESKSTTAMMYNLFPEDSRSRVDVSAVLSVLAMYGVDGSVLE